MRRSRFVLDHARLTGCLALWWPPQLSFSFAGYCLFTLLHVLTDVFLLDLTAHCFRRSHYSTVFDCSCKSSREFNGLFLLRALGCLKLVFHWSAAVYHLLIDTVQFVWSYVPAGRQVIQFSNRRRSNSIPWCNFLRTCRNIEVFFISSWNNVVFNAVHFLFVL